MAAMNAMNRSMTSEYNPQTCTSNDDRSPQSPGPLETQPDGDSVGGPESETLSQQTASAFAGWDRLKRCWKNGSARGFRSFAILVVVFLFGWSVPGAPATASKRPNVIFILTDDQGWADAHFNGHPWVKTP